jgi:AmmeMemoRadiSam system protein B
MSIRLPAVSGSFYPAEAQELTRLLEGLFAMSRPVDTKVVAKPTPIQMLIVPHAGYEYSGQVAANAFQQLESFKQDIKRVVLLGPSHRVAFTGIALPGYESFETPLGRVSVDTMAFRQALACPGVTIRDDAHLQEHSLEVQIPFLQTVLGAFDILPLVVGAASVEDVQNMLESLWQPNTLIVVSTDLSHFLYSADAERIDGRTCERIHELASDIKSDQACGHYPLNGALAFAKSKGWAAHEIAHCHSGNVTGVMDKVVGYASFAVGETTHEH